MRLGIFCIAMAQEEMCWWQMDTKWERASERASERAFCGCTMYFYRLRTHLLCETTWMDGGMNE